MPGQTGEDFGICVLEGHVSHGERHVADHVYASFENGDPGFGEPFVLVLPGELLQIAVEFFVAAVKRGSVVMLMERFYFDFGHRSNHHRSDSESLLEGFARVRRIRHHLHEGIASLVAENG